jgi:hypothetical protein
LVGVIKDLIARLDQLDEEKKRALTIDKGDVSAYNPDPVTESAVQKYPEAKGLKLISYTPQEGDDRAFLSNAGQLQKLIETSRTADQSITRRASVI